MLAVAPAAALYRASGLVLWHDSEVSPLLAYVRHRGKTGQHLLAVSFSQFDPSETLRPSRMLLRKMIVNPISLVAIS